MKHIKFAGFILLILVVAVIATLSTAARADHPYSDAGTFTLDIHGFSKHSDRCYRGCTKEYNEQNYGLGLTYASRDWLDLSVGTFKNSFNNQSTYAALAFNNDIHYGLITMSPTLMLGVTTGYEGISKRSWGTYSPVVVPSLTFKAGAFSTNVGFIPQGFGGKSSVLTFRFGIELN